mmetsp:Transcript_36355/g.72365  ORF Transcript_36355/g.72365 Transcript_36355/m.72365 type:complete len:208 (-) Transcript_36355:765-1388(-)
MHWWQRRVPKVMLFQPLAQVVVQGTLHKAGWAALSEHALGKFVHLEQAQAVLPVARIVDPDEVGWQRLVRQHVAREDHLRGEDRYDELACFVEAAREASNGHANQHSDHCHQAQRTDKDSGLPHSGRKSHEAIEREHKPRRVCRGEDGVYRDSRNKVSGRGVHAVRVLAFEKRANLWLLEEGVEQRVHVAVEDGDEDGARGGEDGLV